MAFEPIPGRPGFFRDSDSPEQIRSIYEGSADRYYREDTYDDAFIGAWRTDQYDRHPRRKRAQRKARVRRNRIRRLDKQLRCAEWNGPWSKHVDRSLSKNGIWLCRQYGLLPVKGGNGIFYDLLDEPLEGEGRRQVCVRNWRDGEYLFGLDMLFLPDPMQDFDADAPRDVLFFNEVLAEKAKNATKEIP